MALPFGRRPTAAPGAARGAVLTVPALVPVAGRLGPETRAAFPFDAPLAGPG